MISMVVNKKTRHRIALLLFGAYLILLFYFLFFSEAMGRSGIDAEYHYNLTPFLEIKRFLRYRDVLGAEAVFLNIFGNVIAFMPFGFFVPMITKWHKNIAYVTLYSFELSLLAETMQLVFKIGSFDIDDLMLNTLGGLCGCIIYHIMRWIRSKYHGIRKKKA